MNIKIDNKIITIRNSSWEDYKYCYLLTKKNMYIFYTNHKLKWNPASYRRNFIPESVKILEYNKKRIGFYKLIFKEDSWYLADLQISRLFRGKGLGTKTMTHIESLVKNSGCKSIKLRVFYDNPALNLYKRMNYEIIDNEDSSLLMIKNL